MSEKILQIRTLSSLAKVFPSRVYGRGSKKTDAVRGQEVSFQIAFRLTEPVYRQREYQIRVTSKLEQCMTFSRVGYVPAELAAYFNKKDDNYLKTTPGLYPDPLYPLQAPRITAASGIWRTLWVSAEIAEDAVPGRYPVKIEFLDDNGEVAANCSYSITVHDVVLPPAKLLYTQWFYCDCIADAHRVEIFSEEHWRLIEDYIRLAAKHGMNMILTPILTPPLDTAVGGERPTVQLVEIEKNGDRFSFDFSRLVRFATIARKYGIEDFEINHFFTQWGANFTPKVMAKENGEVRRIFGWETSSTDPLYVSFLGQLIPQLIEAFDQMGIEREQLWFHVSDEPHKEHLEHYGECKKILYPLIEGCHHIDALSDLEFYKNGVVKTPVVASNCIDPFLNADISDLWCYYCCVQAVKVSNRFFSMPSPRTRIIGIQMYKYGIKGFLHWGYNFYNSQLSKQRIDPFAVTDAGGAYPAGDAFSVYPYGDTVIPSLRQKVFAKALEDVRLLQLLEEKIGKARVIAEIEALAGGELTFSSYPQDEQFFEALYQRIFALLNQ